MTLYDFLKILHILSATMLLASLGVNIHLWMNYPRPREAATVAYRIQAQTFTLILPLILVQLGTGFTMLSLEQNDFNQTWIVGSVLGFVTVVGSWFSFIYFLLQAQQISTRDSSKRFTADKYRFFRRAQSVMLVICVTALLCMIFFMTNKT